MNRRTLLTRIVAGFTAVGFVGFSIPFIRSWIPAVSGEVVLDVDVSDLATGKIQQVRWLGRNVLLIRRDKTSLDTLGNTPLEDAASSAAQQPKFAKNDHRSLKPEHLVVYANCTHLGCEVAARFEEAFEGFNCPCHFSRFDAAGRVEKGSAAKLNLEVPHYEYIGREVIRLKQVKENA